MRDYKFSKARKSSEELPFSDNSVVSGCRPLCPATCRPKRKGGSQYGSVMEGGWGEEGLVEGEGEGEGEEGEVRVEESLLMSPVRKVKGRKEIEERVWNGFVGWEEKGTLRIATEESRYGRGLLLFFPFCHFYSNLIFFSEQKL